MRDQNCSISPFVLIFIHPPPPSVYDRLYFPSGKLAELAGSQAGKCFKTLVIFAQHDSLTTWAEVAMLSSTVLTLPSMLANLVTSLGVGMCASLTYWLINSVICINGQANNWAKLHLLAGKVNNIWAAVGSDRSLPVVYISGRLCHVSCVKVNL